MVYGLLKAVLILYDSSIHFYDFDLLLIFVTCPKLSCTNTINYSLEFVDINECNNATSPCHSNATCHNTDGSHLCTCFKGYSGDGKNCSGMYYDTCLE